ncbi:MAG: Imm26 family immunity protein [Acidimicrobiales bacterium]
MARRLPYTVGDWFCVPLRDGRWGAGRIVSVHPGGKALLGYFFAPFAQPPSADVVASLEPAKAILIGKCGDSAIRRSAWPLVRSDVQFDAERWPLPVFRNRDPITGVLRRVVYGDGDLLMPVVFSVSDDPSLADAPEDGAMGTGFVEVRLTRLSESLPAP